MWIPTKPKQLICDHVNRVPLKELYSRYGGSVDKIRGFLQRNNQWVPYKIGKVKIPEEEVIKLYKQDVSKEEIAKRLNVSTSPVIDILKKHQIRKPMWAKDISYTKYKILDDSTTVIKAFSTLISKENVCEYFDIGMSMVNTLIKKHNIQNTTRGEIRSMLSRSRKNDSNTLVPILKSTMIELRTKQMLTVEEISKYFGISIDYTRNFLAKWNIPKPTFNQRKGLSASRLEQLYVTNNKSVRSIMRKVNCSADTITNRLKRYGLYKSLDDIKTEYKNRLPLDTIKKLHFEENVSLKQISLKFNVSYERIHQLLKDNNITPLRYKEHTCSNKFLELRKDKITLKGLIIDQELTLNKIADMYQCSPSAISQLAQKYDIIIPRKVQSEPEKEIGGYVQNILPNENVVFCNRKVISPFELDIYIPSKNVAIEYCGLYWHSELQGKSRTYHLNKLNRCMSRGIRLITLFDDEYLDNPKLVCSKLKNILGVSNLQKIDARKCVVREISNAEKKAFLDRNHIQGNDISRIKLGLFLNELLVAVMTFAKPSISRASRTMTKQEGLWELNRFATDNNYAVRGGAGKLLAFFERNYDWKTIYSYADRRWSTGSLYTLLGFRQTSVSPPNYWYVPRGSYDVREYRYNYTKFSLVEQGYSCNKTENQIMRERGFTRIWDCGALKFEK